MEELKNFQQENRDIMKEMEELKKFLKENPDIMKEIAETKITLPFVTVKKA